MCKVFGYTFPFFYKCSQRRCMSMKADKHDYRVVLLSRYLVGIIKDNKPFKYKINRFIDNVTKVKMILNQT